jgi:hypothetical protein
MDYPHGWLEARSIVDYGEWHRVCSVPCDRAIEVAGMHVRVLAPGMTTSNEFRIEPGAGVARFRVAGGSDGARRLGLWGLYVGAPLLLAGMALYGGGRIEDSDGLATAGVVTLGVGGVVVLGSLPLLLIGTTRVRDARGSEIAARDSYRY